MLPMQGGELNLERCPHCRVDTPSLPRKGGFDTTGMVTKEKRYWAMYGCTRCGGVVTASSVTDTSQTTRVFPAADELSESVPNPAKEFLKQAIDSVHSPAASVMVAASAVDAMLKAKGYSDGSLYSRINKAAEDHLITSEMAEWAHEVRLDANDQRHADEEAVLPIENDARRSIEFARALAEFIFVLPARVKRGRTN